MTEREALAQMADDIKALREQSEFWHADLPGGGTRAERVDEMIAAWSNIKAGRQTILRFGQGLLWLSALVTSVALLKDGAAEALKEWLK